MKPGTSLCVALLMGTALVALPACTKQKEGPAEHVGKEMDKGVAKVGQELEKAGASIQDSVKGDKVEKK